MEHLSENTIKKAAISFFKTYYKFRPRVGKTTSTFDLETPDGIIVDGSLSFQQEDGSTFLATFETTSLATKGEVIYKIQSKILLWDSLAVSFLVTSMVASYGFYYDHFTINQIGWIGSICLMIGVFGIAFLSYQYLFQWLKRYRYIYAIEQFKKYHADDQWIAVAEDVFEEATDPYLKELKDQCIINGFGLIVVDNDLSSHVIITPSRNEIFGNKRSSMRALSKENEVQRSRLDQLKLWWNNLLTKPKSKSSLLRYQRSYWNQIFLSLISLFIIGVIFFKEAQDAEITYVDEKKYEKELSKKADEAIPETKDFVVDSAFVESSKTKAQPYILVSEDEEEPEEVFTEKGIGSDDTNSEYSDVEILITTLDGEFVMYDCERFFNYIGTKYLIEEGLYSSIEIARKKIEELNNKGVNANALSTRCFSKGKVAYVVFVDLLFDKREEATLISRSLQRKFHFKDGELKIRPIALQKP